LGLFIAVVLLLLIGFSFPAKLDMSQSIFVDAPASHTFEEVSDLKNWQRWSYWQARDTSIHLSRKEATQKSQTDFSIITGSIHFRGGLANSY
jgi:hypothetical protein